MFKPYWMFNFDAETGAGGGGNGGSDPQPPAPKNPSSGENATTDWKAEAETWQSRATSWQGRHDRLHSSYQDLQKLHQATEEQLKSITGERDDYRKKLDDLTPEHEKVVRRLTRMEKLVKEYPDLLEFTDEVMLFPEEGDGLDARLKAFAEKVKARKNAHDDGPRGATPPPPNSQENKDPGDAKSIREEAIRALAQHNNAEYERLMSLYYEKVRGA